MGNKNLDGSEDLTLGGPNAVKLYPYSEQSAENGYIASFELFSKLPNIASYNHKIGLFYDMGNVYQERKILIQHFKEKLYKILVWDTTHHLMISFKNTNSLGFKLKTNK